jgi:hypothetical protein
VDDISFQRSEEVNAVKGSHWLRRVVQVSRRGAQLLERHGLVLPTLLAACGSAGGANQSAPPPVFGGEGATIGPPREIALTTQTSATKPAGGPCAEKSPPSDTALVDDFEDDDQAAFKGFQREGWWFSAGDATESAKLSPERGTFRPERLPTAEATRDNLFAAHLKAEGQKDWGAVWGVSLRWESKGVRCPLNASGFAGVRFRARGPGTVRLAFGMPETEPPDAGGTCTSGCYDVHGKVFFLTDRWDDYLVRWDRLEQQGWGNQARFDPARIVSLQLAAKPKDLPADFWIDDVAFVNEREADVLAASIRAEPVTDPKPLAERPAPSPSAKPPGKTAKPQ